MKLVKILLFILLTVQVFALGKVMPSTSEKNGNIIEIVTFKLKEGVSIEDFKPLDKDVEVQHVSKQPGFVSRETGADEDGNWLVIVHWNSIEEAEASMASFSEAPGTKEFMDKVVLETMTMKRYFKK